MKFGEKLLQSRYEPWIPYYLDYDELKRVLKTDVDEYPLLRVNTSQGNLSAFQQKHHRRVTSNASLSGLVTTQTSQGLPNFIVCLNQQVERILIFFLQEQACIASELQACRQEQARLQRQSAKATEIQELAWSTALAAEEQHQEQQRLTPEELELFHKFYIVAVHLLRLIQFVDLNMTGLRKILKKHDKTFNARLVRVYLGRRSVILQPLVSNDSIDALTKLLESALKEWTEFVRERNCIDHLVLSSRSFEWSAQSPLPLKKAWSFVAIVPQTHVDLENVFGGFARQQDGNKIRSSRAILLQIKAARCRLQETTDLQRMLAAPVLVLNNQEQSGSTEDSPEEDTLEDDDEMSTDRAISNFLNYSSTFLYMANYYIVAPASNTYAEKLGGNASLAGIIIGMTPVAALVSTLLYSWWTSYSYKSALIFASVCSCTGNLCYGLGLPLNSLTFVLVGRLLNGFGSARSINRRYIADSYSRVHRTAASATFVTAGTLGCSLGPAIAAILEFSIPDDNGAAPTNPYWQVENAPGWIMFCVWAVYLVLLVLFFKDPPRRLPKQKVTKQQPSPQLSTQKEWGEETQPLLSTVDNTPTEITLLKRGTLYEYIPVIVPFTIYFILKLILEATVSSVSMITHHYFKWNGQWSGTYLAILGLLVLPANAAVAYLSESYEDRVLIVGIQLVMTVGCFGLLSYGDIHDYPLGQYLIASVVCYVSSSALEGPNMSLLSKTIPQSWSQGFFNSGLLATEAGTLGRAVADVMISACGRGGMDYVLNRMFGICSGLSLALLALSLQFYSQLLPRVEQDDL